MPAVAVHHTTTTSAAWDGPGQVAKLRDAYTEADLKDLFAWVPSGADPKKSACKFPHHMVGADGTPGAANVAGCQAGIGVLNGAMGGASIPDGDRQGVYNHLAAHLKDAGVTPAELKSAPRPPVHPLAARASTGGVVERRSRPFTGAELRAIPDGTGGSNLVFTGYASVVDEPYEMADMFGPYTEVVRAGAFTKTLSEGADVPFKVNHEGISLARTKSGTMRLAEDSTGLNVEADLDPDSPAVQVLRSAMNRGDVDEMSFAFWVTRQMWSPDWEQRDILEVNLNRGDVSVVNFGANPATAGAALRGHQLQSHLQRLPAEERAAALESLVRGLAPQMRAGELPADAAETIARALQLVAAADHAVDVAQPMLAELIGVPNPDLDAQTDAQSNAHPLGLYQALAYRAGL